MNYVKIHLHQSRAHCQYQYRLFLGHFIVKSNAYDVPILN